MKKLLALCGALLLSVSSTFAQSLPAPNIAAKSWLVMDVTSGQILASQDPDMRIEPASLTKIMTAYLAFEAVKEKKLSLDQMITVSVNAWKVEGDSSKMFIEPNKPVSVQDLLYGLIVQSGNDAAIALAEAVSGSEDAFVALMNREVQKMGLKSTHFSNPHGLPSPDTYSSARDVATMSADLIRDFPDLYKIYSTKSFTYNKIKQQNRNRLLWLDPTVDGMKTGHTQAAGYCLVATAKRPNGSGERRVLTVLLGAQSDALRAQESQKLLNWGFQNFDTVKLYGKGQAVATPAVWKGSQNSVKVGFDHDVFITVPKGMAEKLKPELQRKDPLIAPIQQNAPIGTLKITADGKEITSLPVVALEQVNQATVFGRAWDSIRLLVK